MPEQHIIQHSAQVARLFADIISITEERRFQFLFPETLLICLLKDERLVAVLKKFKVDVKSVVSDVEAYLGDVEVVPPGRPSGSSPVGSSMFNEVFSAAEAASRAEGTECVLNHHFFMGVISVADTVAQRALLNVMDFNRMRLVCMEYGRVCREADDAVPAADSRLSVRRVPADGNGDVDVDDNLDSVFQSGDNPMTDACVRIDDSVEYADAPFSGRENELRKAAMVLCKRSKCNIVFVGDRGVGKSSMISGLIQYVKKLRKRSVLGRARFFKINPAIISAGAQFVGELEGRISSIVGDIKSGEMVVLFADNMSEMMPQSNNDSTPDALRLLTSLTEGTEIRIVTTATYDQFKRLSNHNSNVERYFTRIDIAEPALDPDGRDMVLASAKALLNYHSVVSDSKTLCMVADVAQNSLGHDVAMPGRAIDLIDNICAYVSMENSSKGKSKTPMQVDNDTLLATLKMLGVDAIASKVDRDGKLKDLEASLLSKIYGQDEAVHGVSESILLAKAGLTDESKPLAAYLFVGPTGVGKTELARVLAAELGVQLVRFDMSEYSEQHSVAKLVGSPAGYVGYDDGGLLTDSVRKNPSCVLLLDEIEKAHPAVFNLLLQVLDYACLTDNRGQKADFSDCVIIMTSNAGARFATGTGLGFGASGQKSDVMQKELKRTFAPEFLNRLTQVVSFHDMDQVMAAKILDRKIAELANVVRKRKDVSFSLTDDARNLLLKEGFSTNYGAREMDRAIGRLLKPVLMRALLFEGVGEGGSIVVGVADGALVASK